MNLAEFKAWFEGYTENMSGPPNKQQWARIQERIAEIKEKPTPAPVIIRELERYWPRRRFWDDIWVGGGTYQRAGGSTGDRLPDWPQTVCSSDAFKAIGRAEYLA